VTDSARAVLGLTLAAATVPYLPWVRGRAITRGAFAALSGGWVAYPLASRWQIWLLVFALTALAAIGSVDRGRERERLPSKVPVTAAAAAAIALGAALLLDAGGTWRAVERGLESDSAVAITLGLLATVFPLGAAIGALTAPWAREVERHVGPTEGLPHGLQGAGAYIGWLERSAIFVAVVLGHPGAVAAIFTAKSVARFPSFTREAFAEYYLIGTLLSLFGATAAAVGIRLALGLSAI
jgi:small-conductance mechanosensitive channel